MRSSQPLLLILLACSVSATAQIDEIIKQVDTSLQHRNTSGLSHNKIIAGLKQALQLSTSRAVAVTGRPDGFLKNDAIKIALPPRLETVGRGLRFIGLGSKVDELEVGMNRAAEQATPQAKQIFLAALKQRPFDDAPHILTGNDTADPDAFQRHRPPALTTAFP